MCKHSNIVWLSWEGMQKRAYCSNCEKYLNRYIQNGQKKPDEKETNKKDKAK